MMRKFFLWALFLTPFPVLAGAPTHKYEYGDRVWVAQGSGGRAMTGPGYMPVGGGTFSGTVTLGTGSKLHLNDDILLQLGNTAAAPDWWLEHDTSTTPDELALTTTDSDGGGTNKKLIAFPDGTDNIVLTADLYSNDNEEHCFGTDCDFKLQWDNTNSRGEIVSAAAFSLRFEDNGGNAMATLTDGGTSGIFSVQNHTGSGTIVVFDNATDGGAVVLQGLGNANGEVNTWLGSNYSDAQSGNLGTLVAAATDADNSGLLRVVKWSIKRDGLELHTPQSVTCADNGAGTNAVLTITPSSSYIEVTSADAQGCDVTMGETNMEKGDRVEICIVSLTAGAVNFADTAGVSDIAGAFAADIDDCISLRYGTGLTWRQVGRDAN